MAIFIENNKSINPSSNVTENQGALSIARPWVRFFARHIDIYIFSLIVGMFIGIFQASLLASDIVISMFSLLLWILVEAALLSTWGTTFGKWLLRVSIKDNEGKKLTFSAALKRSFLVYFKGLGMGLPVVSLCTLITAHTELTRKGITTWDRDNHFQIIHQKISVFRTIVAVLLLGLFLVGLICLKS